MRIRNKGQVILEFLIVASVLILVVSYVKYTHHLETLKTLKFQQNFRKAMQ